MSVNSIEPMVTAPTSEPPADRIPVIDLIRLLSILLVLAPHTTLTGVTRPYPAPIPWILFARNGFYGVLLFFVISGLVITRMILRTTPDLARLSLRGFYSRRVSRIVPLWLLSMAAGVAVFLVLPATGLYGTQAGSACVRDPATAYDGWFWLSLPTFCFNWLRLLRHGSYGLQWDVLWSLAIEEQFYLCYPLLLLCLSRRRWIVGCLLGMVVLGPLARLAAHGLSGGDFHATMTNSFAAFDLLAMGALLALFLDWAGPGPGRWVRPPVEILVGVLGLLCFLSSYACTRLGRPGDRVWGPSVLGLSLCVFLAVAIRRQWGRSGALGLLALLGRYSYGAYLLHPLVLLCLWPVLSGRPVVTVFCWFAAASLLLAGLVHHLYEIPANRAVRRWLLAAVRKAP